MSGRVFLDTNVLVYLFDQDTPQKRDQARRILQDAALIDDLVISTQVLQELYVTVTRKLKRPLAEADALTAVRSFGQLATVQVDTPMIERAIEFSQQHRISFWDALIVQAALEAGCNRLLTEDLHGGWSIDRLRVENPFA
jgi:predicted nucleic acid-binding protein